MQDQRSTTPSHKTLPLLLVPCLFCLLFSSCASEGVQERMDRRNSVMDSIGENSSIRRQARDERFQKSRDRLFY